MFGFIGRLWWRITHKAWTRKQVEEYWSDCAGLSMLIDKLDKDGYKWRGNYPHVDFNKTAQEFMANTENNCGDWAEICIEFLKFQQLTDKIVLVYAEKFDGNIWNYLYKPQWHWLTVYESAGVWHKQENASVCDIGVSQNVPEIAISNYLHEKGYNRVEFYPVI
jgi:hypothetical protein